MEPIYKPLNVVLHRNQEKIHNNPARFKVIKAGKRFGKSIWALFEICQAAAKKPNGMFWYIAPTYKQAKSIAWHTLKWMLPHEYVHKWLEQDLVVVLKHNGARIELKGSDNEDSLRGAGIDGVVFDERAYQSEAIWNAIIRGQLAGSKGFAYFISSPNSRGRNHYTNFFAEAEGRMKAGDKEWFAGFYTIYDNPTLSLDEIEKMRAGMPEYMWNLEYMAQESDSAGQLYNEFNWDNNVSECPNNSKFMLVRGIDSGLQHPTVCLWAKIDVERKRVYIVNEYVKTGYTVSENCSVIEKMTGMDIVDWTVIDPETAKRERVSNRSLQDEFIRCGIGCIPGDRGTRGINILKMFLKTGMLKIHPKCKTLIYELQNLQWGDKEGDDCTDTLRYVCARIHDSINGMNLFIDQNVKQFKSENPNEYSFRDSMLFPKTKLNQSWLMEAINAA